MFIHNFDYRKFAVFFAFFSGFAHACIFPISKTKPAKNPARDYWDEKIHPRKYSMDFDCVCGEDSDYVRKPWNFHVHITNPTWTRVCTGTLITSNLVITSHSCLIRDGKMSPYEAWVPPPKNKVIYGGPEARVAPENIKLTIYPKDDNSTILIVSQIAYNLRFTVNSVTGRFPGDDIAILVLSQHISLHEKFRPICIPEFDPNLDVSRQIGRYYGVGAQVSGDPTPEFRTASELLVLEGPECDIEAGFGKFSTKQSLCVRFRLPAPTIEGGPLMLRKVQDPTKEHDHNAIATAFLVGISSVAVKKREGTRLSYVYFTNIIPMIKYIELQALNHGSKWCRTPVKFTVKSKVFLDYVLQPWEKQPESSYSRDESLDCRCGIKNNEVASRNGPGQARIAGGEEAVPYEFGWQARINFLFYGGTSRYCGGSIINNLFILTAAHCAVSTPLLIKYGKEAEEKILPEYAQVYIRTHTRNNDPHELEFTVKKVIVHPEYVDAEWEYQDRNARKRDYMFYLGSDIALLLLDKPITFSNSAATTNLDIRPICLPQREKFVEFIGKMATVSGWGIINPEAPHSLQVSSENLQKLDKPIIPLTQCSQHSELVITDDVICAGYLNRSKDSASGDSGGPLIIKDYGSGSWIQIGIVSYGVDYYENRKYKLTTAHYTNVQNFLRFVDYYSKSVRAQWCQSPV